MTPPAAIIFDCDGVLVDSETIALEVEMETLALHGMRYDPIVFRRRFLGMADAAFFAEIEADAHAQNITLPPSFRADLRTRVRAAFDDRLFEIAGAARAVAAVAQAKAVASSSSTAGLERKLKKTALWDAFAPHVYSADLVGHGKPAPDIFLHAAGALAAPPAGCIVLEDSVNGVLAARAAGMTAWGFIGGGHHDSGAADALRTAGAARILEDWAEAEVLFAAWR